MQTGGSRAYITQAEVIEMTVLFAAVFAIIAVALLLTRFRRKKGESVLEQGIPLPSDPDSLVRRGLITPEEAARMKAKMAERLLRAPTAPGERIQQAVDMERVRETAPPEAVPSPPPDALPERLRKFADLSDDQLEALAQARFLEPGDIATIRKARGRS